MKNWEKLEADKNLILSKHFSSGRGGNKVNKVVVHYNAGNLTVAGCYNVWQNREASAHYQVEDDGYIGQLVWDSDTAWHAGVWNVNQTSIGIEHANNADGTITNECLDNGAHLVAAICKYYGLGRPEWLKNVFPHKHFKATSCPGQIYGSQKDAYIKRAQQWYDYMVGNGSAPGEVGNTVSSNNSNTSGGLNLGDTKWFGPKFCKELQGQLGTTQDGYLSGQSNSNKKYFWAVSGGVKYGSGGSNCIRKLQSGLIKKGYSCGSAGADGDYGYYSIIAHQTWLRDAGYYNGKIDGYHGNQTNVAMGKALAAGAYKGF